MELNLTQLATACAGEGNDWALDAQNQCWGQGMLGADVFDTMFYHHAEPPDVERTAPWKGETDDFSQADSVLSIVNLNPQDELDPGDVEAGECWGIPCDLPELLQKSGAKKNKSAPPDISNGLGRSQSKRDIVKLEEHIVRSARFMVYDGVLCAYEKPCWRKLENEEAEIMIRKVLEEAGLGDCLVYQDFCKIRKNLRTNPRIQVKKELLPPEDRINFLDGTYDLERKRLYPHDPDDYFFHAVKCRGGDMESCPGEVFEAFVEQLSDGDPAVRQQLLELAALTILGKQVKYFYVLLGESHTGKTQFGRFLEELVGRENVESVRGVHDFSDRWTVGALKGKLLATCLDIPDAPLPKEAVGTIKQFVGDDPVKGERKNKDPFTFYRKPLLLFAGNHSLRIPNMAQEQALYKQLLAEAPYIVGQALKAYEDLVQNNFQVMRAEIPPEYAPQEGRREAQRAIDCLERHCCREVGAEMATADIYDRYCEAVDGGSRLNAIAFSRVLSKYVQGWEMVSQLKRVNGEERRGYRAIRLILSDRTALRAIYYSIDKLWRWRYECIRILHNVQWSAWKAGEARAAPGTVPPAPHHPGPI